MGGGVHEQHRIGTHSLKMIQTETPFHVRVSKESTPGELVARPVPTEKHFLAHQSSGATHHPMSRFVWP